MNTLTGDCDCSYLVTEGNERAIVAVLGLLSLLCIATIIAGIVLLLYPRLLHNSLKKFRSLKESRDVCGRDCNKDDYWSCNKQSSPSSSPLYTDERMFPDNNDSNHAYRSFSDESECMETIRSFSPGILEEKDNANSCMQTYRSFSPGYFDERMYDGNDNLISCMQTYRRVQSPLPFCNQMWPDQKNYRQRYVIDTCMRDDRLMSPARNRRNETNYVEAYDEPGNLNDSRECEDPSSIMSSILLWRDEVNNAQRNNVICNMDVSTSVNGEMASDLMQARAPSVQDRTRQPSPAMRKFPSSSISVQPRSSLTQDRIFLSSSVSVQRPRSSLTQDREFPSSSISVQPRSSLTQDREFPSSSISVQPSSSLTQDREFPSSLISVQPRSSLTQDREFPSSSISVQPRSSLTQDREFPSSSISVQPSSSLTQDREFPSSSISVQPRSSLTQDRRSRSSLTEDRSVQKLTAELSKVFPSSPSPMQRSRAPLTQDRIFQSSPRLVQVFPSSPNLLQSRPSLTEVRVFPSSPSLVQRSRPSLTEDRLFPSSPNLVQMSRAPLTQDRISQNSPSLVQLFPSSPSLVQRSRQSLTEDRVFPSSPSLLQRSRAPLSQDRISQSSPSLVQMFPSSPNLVQMSRAPLTQDRVFPSSPSLLQRSRQSLTEDRVFPSSPSLVQMSRAPLTQDRRSMEHNYILESRSPLPDEYNMGPLPPLPPRPIYHEENLLQSYQEADRLRADNQVNQPRICNEEDILKICQAADRFRICQETDRSRSYIAPERSRVDNQVNQQRSYRALERSRVAQRADGRTSHVVFKDDIDTSTGGLHFNVHTQMYDDGILAGHYITQVDDRDRLQDDFDVSLQESYPLSSSQMLSQCHESTAGSTIESICWDRRDNEFHGDENMMRNRVPDLNTSRTSAIMSSPIDYDDMYTEENIDTSTLLIETPYSHDASVN
uniref:uncharacterized protein isoform X10 n=1 Tax=Pristiophorus japonicus TaxID=55135 RepID=UPI00398E965E